MIKLTPEQAKIKKAKEINLLNKVIDLTNVEYQLKDIYCFELVEDLVRIIENHKKSFNLAFEEMAKELPMYEKSIISEFEQKFLKKMRDINGKRN